MGFEYNRDTTFTVYKLKGRGKATGSKLEKIGELPGRHGQWNEAMQSVIELNPHLDSGTYAITNGGVAQIDSLRFFNVEVERKPSITVEALN